MPVGFKNSTDGGTQIAVDAVLTARSPHWFPSVTKQGVAAIFQTVGNDACHVILRGGTRTGRTYDAEHVAKVGARLAAKGLREGVMVDCSHGNSLKDHKKQADVAASILRPGRRRLAPRFRRHARKPSRRGPAGLRAGRPAVYGQSITDACLSLEDTVPLLERFAQAQRTRGRIPQSGGSRETHHHRPRRAARRIGVLRAIAGSRDPVRREHQLPQAAARDERRRGVRVAVNSKGEVAIFTRSNSAGGPAYGATASQVLLFDKTGKFLREVGKGLYAWSYAHAIRFDKDDNLWAIDKGSDMIVRINPEGHVTMVFGRKKEASDDAEPWKRVTPPLAPTPGQFRQPTDVAWDTEGNIYISDGYINSRVAKFTKDGDWVASIGEPGRTKIGELNTPHTISYDAKGNIYVGDRGNRRIQVIDPKTNTLVREIKIDVPVPPDAKPWIGRDADRRGRRRAERRAVGESASRRPTPPASSSSTARTRSPGASTNCRSPTARCLAGSGKSGHQAKQFGWIHEIACPSENEIYVAELLNWRLQKLTLKPVATRGTAPGQ